MHKLWQGLGALESLSLILLMNIAMPLKYLADQPLPVRYLGMLHGVLFIAYTALTGLLFLKERWRFGYFIEACASAWVPFGFLILDPPVKKMSVDGAELND